MQLYSYPALMIDGESSVPVNMIAESYGYAVLAGETLRGEGRLWAGFGDCIVVDLPRLFCSTCQSHVCSCPGFVEI